MKSYDWRSLDEAGKYAVWSLHMDAVNDPAHEMSYPFFCDLMDAFTEPIN